MMPGISARPSASMVSFAAASTAPRPVIFPSDTATSPRAGGEPRPSSSSALRIRRSCTLAEYTEPVSMDVFSVEGKVAVITGGASGIGASTARLFEQAGAKVAILDIATGCDVTDEKAVVRALGDVESERGGIDILVNSAGRAVRKTATELTGEEWDQVLDLNLKATFICARTAMPYMKRRGAGSIVNLASIMGASGGIFPNASYQASKGAVVNLTRALAPEWAPDNIRVNAVAPTFVRTELTVPIFSNPEVLKRVMHHTPLGRLPEPDEIAAAIVYLCSPAARCITGITLPVDSGFLAR